MYFAVCTSEKEPMSSVAPPASLMQAVLDGPLPTFVALPERFRCDVCRSILKDPWQTECGHRMCLACMTKTFESAEEVMCPAYDEDCVMISKDWVSNLYTTLLIHIIDDLVSRKDR